MFNNIFIYLMCTVFIVSLSSGLESGSSCDVDGRSGKCLPARECLSAKESFTKNGTLPSITAVIIRDGPTDETWCLLLYYNTEGNSSSTSDGTICSSGEDVLVCCATDKTTESGPATTPRLLIRPSDGCEPLTSVTAPEVGIKSWNKCLEYQEKIIRPCVDIVLAEGKYRSSKCNRDSLTLIVQNQVLEDEFPHMVLLGYGDNISTMSWLCEGVIISERFILTLAMCSSHREYGPVKYIRTGVLNISVPADESRVFKVKRTVRHPLYKAPKPYYNIALLELDSDIPLDLSAVPACVDVGNLPSYKHALALGWNRNRGNSLLQKRHLYEAASSDVCVDRGGRYSFDKATEICYFNEYDKENYYGFERILQIEHVKCMYVIIGLDFRHGTYPGIPFIRLSAFVPWIESIVWP